MSYIERLSDDKIENILKSNDVCMDNNKIKCEHSFAYKYAYDMTNKEGNQSAQAFYHNLNTLESRAGSQVPFSSINEGRDTSTEGRLVTKWLLNASLDGIGKFHRTSIFPISIFQYKKSVNGDKTSPNYDLKKLAIKSMCKRIYPNWVNNDLSWFPEENGNPDTYHNTMGCIDGDEVVTYKYHNILYVESIRRMWNRISDNFSIEKQGNSKFVNTDNTQIYDSKNGFVNVNKIIKNQNNQWMQIKFSNGRSAVVTNNHPFPVLDRGRTFAENLNIGDKINCIPTQYAEETINYEVSKAWLLGFILCDGCYSNGRITSSIALDSENDIEQCYKQYMKKDFNVDVETVVQHRGDKGNYKDLIGLNKDNVSIIQYFTEKYGGVNKKKRHIPNEVFSWNKESKLAFMAGMIDADGYINNDKNKCIVQIGSTNKELAIQQMLLAQSLEMPSKLYLNKYNKQRPNSIRYRVEFTPSKDLIEFIISKKKRNNYIPYTNDIVHNVSEVTEIKYLTNKNDESYDVTTDSDHFDFSGIYSHNCRTQLGYDIYGMGYSQIGRGNICPTTMILPKLGIEYGICLGKRDKADIEGFWNGFEKLLEITRKSLMERFYYIASQSPKSAPFMYNNGTIAGAEDCTDNVFNAVKHGTLAVGFIGVAEMCQALFGTNFVHDKEVYKFALSVVKHIYDKCKEWTKKYKLNFSVYATPAENLCHVAATTLRKQYGSIPFVTDKTYVTNSTHVPVWEKVSVYEKLNLEQPFTRYETGGSITYAELDSNLMNNPTAVEKIIDYAMNIGIPYLAINFAIDTCNKCGYQGVIKKCCPICGESEDIDRLARVTGYLSTDKRNFNDGKKDEVADRVNHNLTLNLNNDNILEYSTIRKSVREIMDYIKDGEIA